MPQKLYAYRAPLIGLLVGILAVVAFVLVGMRGETVTDAVETDPLIMAKNFVREGYLLTGHPQLKPDTWYLVHSQEGEQAKAAELYFDDQSLCASAKASGVCRPELFINQRPATVEGVWEGEVLRVLELTFTQPVQ